MSTLPSNGRSLSKAHAKRIIQDWIEDECQIRIIRETWPDLFAAYEALCSIADSPSDETSDGECQHDLLRPDTTIEVIDPWKAKCKVCINFFDLPGRPAQKQDARPVCPQCGQINGFHREACPLRHSEKANEHSPDPVYCSQCGQEDRDCYCGPSTPSENGSEQP